MTEKWVLTRRLARSLSRTGLENIFGPEPGYVNDYFGRCVSRLRQMNLDDRAIVARTEMSTFVYGVAYDANPAWVEMLWSHTAMVQLWEDLLAPAEGSVSPLKILTQLVTPSPTVMSELSNNNRDYTFINCADTSFLENLMFSNPDAQHFGDLKYSVIDQQDIIQGQADDEFDLVQVWSWLLHKVNFSSVTKFLDCVKVGGVFVVTNPSDIYTLYESPDTAHFWPHYWLSKHIAQDERFVTYHIPHEVGVIVAKRVR